jgi:predicted TIM-barrel fold metal-dependent hydrolase
MSNSGFKVFDSDLHIIEPPDLWLRYIEARYTDRVPVGETQYPGDIGMRHEGKLWGRPEVPELPGGPKSGEHFRKSAERWRHFEDVGWTGEAQIEAMDEEGIDLSVMFPSRGLFAMTDPNVETDLAAAMARAYNNWLYDFMEPDRERMYGAAMISPFDVDDAVREVRRAVKELGFKAVYFRATLVAKWNWESPYYDPLWAECAELGVPVAFHEATGSGAVPVGQRFAENVMLWHTVSHPLEQMLTVVAMCGGGVLARHPTLRVAFLEGNCSWLPFLLWRLDEHVELFVDVAEEMTMMPSAYFRRQCFASVESDEEPVQYVVADGFLDQVVFSTDFPHPDSKYPNSVDRFLKLGISDAAKKQILWDNSRALYNL